MHEKNTFYFKQFSIRHEDAAMKVGTDGVLLGAWADINNVQRILDIGTGTGLIALMLAQRTSEDTLIDAIEIEQHAFEEACFNVAQSPWKNRITVHHQALQNFSGGPYDLIVCNPPFFQNSMKPPGEKRSLARHTDSLPIERLAAHSKKLLHPNGVVSIIVPFADYSKIKSCFLFEKLHCFRQTQIRTLANKPPERCLLSFAAEMQEKQTDEIILMNDSKNRNASYSALTAEFYLKP